MKILVTFALDNEFAPWRALRKFRPSRWGPVDVFLSDIGACELAVILTGAGPRQAALAISKMIRQDPDFATICISSGFAGALRPEYAVEQIVAARTVVSEDRPETTGRDASETSPAIDGSSALISFASANGATVVEKFYTAGRVVGSALEKNRLGGIADAIEMESYEILRGAASVGIPAIAIRAVSDSSNEDLPFDLNGVFTDEGRVSIPRVIGQLAQHPQSLPGLVRLGQNSRAAAESLARFLESYAGVLASRTGQLHSDVVGAIR